MRRIPGPKTPQNMAVKAPISWMGVWWETILGQYQSSTNYTIEILCKATFNKALITQSFSSSSICNATWKSNKNYIASCKKIKVHTPYWVYQLWLVDPGLPKQRSEIFVPYFSVYRPWKVVAWKCSYYLNLNLTAGLRTARGICVLCVTFIPTGNHHGYIKENKRITYDIPRTSS